MRRRRQSKRQLLVPFGLVGKCQTSVKSNLLTFCSLKGPYACVGKSLALLELRMVTARILRKYNVELAEGVTVEKVLLVALFRR